MPEFHNNHIRIHWEALGEGEPIAFLNGVLMTVDSWKFQTTEFSQGYRCLMHDFRGQLLSSWPDDPWTLEDHAKDFEALLDHVGIERCHLIGTSYGGEVGLLFAATRPERVRSLTVIASVSELGPETDRIVLDWRQAAIASPQSLYRTMLPTTFSEEFIAANPRLTELGEERLQACEPGFFTAFAGLIDAFRDLDITPLLGEIRCPSLVIAAGKDRLKPPHYSRIIADGIPRADLQEIAGAGHAVILEQPDSVNSAIRAFLSASPAG